MQSGYEGFGVSHCRLETDMVANRTPQVEKAWKQTGDRKECRPAHTLMSVQ